MELTLQQQIVALIERSEKILLCTHRKPDGDAVGSIMALTKALNLMGKKVTATCADELPDSFDFLPEIDQLSQSIGQGRDFVVTLDCDQTEVDRLKYHLEDNKIHIVITPKQGRFSQQQVSFSQGSEQFDLIITVDVADIPQLGKLYDENPDLFSSLPVINIDHHISNTQFGKVNWIDVAASSTAEMLYQLIRQLETSSGKKLIVPETATFLLSGITTDTGSFQNANTTPKSMEIAAELMDAGANQQDIIKYLFRTKKLQTLKLYGKILSKIEVDEKHRIVWSSITLQDLKSSGADGDDAAGIIDELMVHAPEAEIVALFKEQEDMVSVSLRSTTDQANVMEIAQQFGGGGHVRAAGAKLKGKSLSQVSNEVLAAIIQYQRRRLGIADESGELQKQPEITQVLEGYTPVPHVSPTLEEKATAAPSATVEPVPFAPETLSSRPEKPVTTPAPQPTQGFPSSAPTPQPAQTPDRTKQAITAEQEDSKMQPPQDSFSPSKAAMQQVRPRPTPEKRFNEPLPDFLRTDQAPPAPPASRDPEPISEPPAAPKERPSPPAPAQPIAQTPPTSPVKPTETPDEDGVKVSYGASITAAPTPEIPADSSEPVVKMAPTSPTIQDAQDVSNALSGFGGFEPDEGSDAPIAPIAPQNTTKPPEAPELPEAPKDPFALGDDGLTDIERALGGL